MFYAPLGILIGIVILLLVTSLKSFGINREYQRGFFSGLAVWEK